MGKPKDDPDFGPDDEIAHITQPQGSCMLSSEVKRQLTQPPPASSGSDAPPPKDPFQKVPRG